MKSYRNTIIEKMAQKGYQLLGSTRGWYTIRKGSKLRELLDRLGIDPSKTQYLTRDTIQKAIASYVVISAAHERTYTEGWQLLVFGRKEQK